MPNILLDTLEWIADLTESVFDSVFPDALRFDEPELQAAFDALPGFDASIDAPTARRCCTIGWRAFHPLGVGTIWSDPVDAAIATEPMSASHLGAHVYGGPGLSTMSVIAPDPVGHAYTRHGGIIDLGHLRDHADLARYAACRAMVVLQTGGWIDLPEDGATLRVELQPKPDRTPEFCSRLGARISYDIAIWHEILTGFANQGLLPWFDNQQPFSAFSPEDNYSNLLGAQLGYRALLRPIPFNDAMTETIETMLIGLGIVGKSTARLAVSYVEDRWFTYVDDELVVLRRHVEPFGTILPWLVTDADAAHKPQERIGLMARLGGAAPPVPILPPDETLLDPYYRFEVEIDPDDFPAGFSDGKTVLLREDLVALVDALRAGYSSSGGTAP